MNVYEDCLNCSNAFSEEEVNSGEGDKLFCVIKQQYVEEDYICDEWN